MTADLTDLRYLYSCGEYVTETERKTAEFLNTLTEDEAEFLHLRLAKGPWKEFVRERHLLPSMLADSINEKLMDMIGDVVIEFDGENPVLVEDYEEELEGLFSGGL